MLMGIRDYEGTASIFFPLETEFLRIALEVILKLDL